MYYTIFSEISTDEEYLNEELKEKENGTKPTCANCEYFINEDGMPYCAIKDLYTEARADDKACISFTLKRSKNGK